MRYSRSRVAPSGLGQVLPARIFEFLGSVSSTIATISLHGGGSRREKTSPAPLLADDELQPRPGLVDRRDLHVDKVELQGLAAHNIFGNVGCDLRGLLRPRHPDHAVRLQRLLQANEVVGDLDLLPREGVDEIKPTSLT